MCFKFTKKNDYDEDKYRKEHSHSLYSVIQPFFDEYELVVFNGSHRLSYSPNPNEHFCVHANIERAMLSKDFTKLKIIKDKSLFSDKYEFSSDGRFHLSGNEIYPHKEIWS